MTEILAKVVAEMTKSRNFQKAAWQRVTTWAAVCTDEGAWFLHGK